MFVLGIDGGGTKTTGVIADEDGRVVAHYTVGATNFNGSNERVVESQLLKLFNELKSQNKNSFNEIEFVFLGMAGAGRNHTQQILTKIVRRIVGNHIPFHIDHDAVNALYSGTLGRPGVVSIAGTGSICFGINSAGERDRVGGWGYLLEDTGSGYEIGRQALIQIFAEFDENKTKSILTSLILRHFKVDQITDLLPQIYEPGQAKRVIAPLCELVFLAADRGDSGAKEILVKSASVTANNLLLLINKLFQDETSIQIPVILTGGVYKRVDWFLPIIKKQLSGKGDVIVPTVSPVAGALVGAFQCAGVPVSEPFIDNLIAAGLIK